MTPGRRLAPLALFLLCALTPIMLTSCTAIGFGVGALTDMSNGKRAPDKLGHVRSGTNITVWLRDGRKMDGQFMGSRDSVSVPASPDTASADASSVAQHRTLLLLATNHGTREIPIESVKRVSVPVVRGKVIGLLYGAGIDTLMVLMFLMALSQVDFS
jgi:hypothetical protein